MRRPWGVLKGKTMNAKTLEAVRRHGLSLLAAFPNATEKDPIALCRKLRRIETSLERPLVDCCNGTFEDDNEGSKLDAVCEKALFRVAALLCGDKLGSYVEQTAGRGLFVNRDPRGYALKFSDKWTREYNNKRYAAKEHTLTLHTDMGGYGIVAPDLNQ